MAVNDKDGSRPTPQVRGKKGLYMSVVAPQRQYSKRVLKIYKWAMMPLKSRLDRLIIFLTSLTGGDGE
jgi:hypothetical protein